MKNGLGVPQGVLLVGGSSDIGVAILERIVGRGVARVATLSRRPEAAASALADLMAGRPETDWIHRSAEMSQPEATVDALEGLLAEMREVDVAVLAVGELTGGLEAGMDASDVARVVAVNMTTQIAIMDRLARAMVSQGAGTIVLLSSVAAERVRPANALYGASKAGVDAYAQALDHSLAGTGVRVLVVRPGFVTTKMTADMPRAPLATTPQKVAATTARALRRGRRVSWSPGPLRVVFMVFRHLPTFVWRRLPL